MAKFMIVGREYVNLDKVCHIQVYTCADDTVIVEVEYDHSVKEIPCAGTEEEVWEHIRFALSRSTGLYQGPYHPTEEET